MNGAGIEQGVTVARGNTLEALPFFAQSREEGEADEHPQLIGMGQPGYRTAGSQIEPGPSSGLLPNCAMSGVAKQLIRRRSSATSATRR